MALSKPIKILVSLIAPVLLTLSFAFALKATLTNNWVVHRSYLVEGLDQQDQGLVHRSLFTLCHVEKPEEDWIEKCPRFTKPGSSCTTLGNGGNDYDSLCQQITIGGQLIIAGIVFAAVGMILTAVLSFCAVLYEPHPLASERHHHQHGRKHRHQETEECSEETGSSEGSPLPAKLLAYLLVPTRIITILATTTLFLSAMIGGNALLNLQPPNGAFASGRQSQSANANWRLDHGYGFATAAWATAAFAALVVDGVWGFQTRGLIL